MNGGIDDGLDWQHWLGFWSNNERNRDVKAILGYAALIVMGLALGIGGWKLERWLNWKLDYGRKVDRRIEQLEKRIEALEQRDANKEVSGGRSTSAGLDG